MKKPTRYWFANKRFGYGWTPSRWQGWLVVAIYVLLVAATVYTYQPIVAPSAWQVTSGILLPVIGFTLILLGITIWTGEKPEWRWGKKDGKAK